MQVAYVLLNERDFKECGSQIDVIQWVKVDLFTF